MLKIYIHPTPCKHYYLLGTPTSIPLSRCRKKGQVPWTGTLDGEVAFNQMHSSGSRFSVVNANGGNVSITSWNAAINAHHEGMKLMVSDLADLNDDISTLKNANFNRATGTERQTTCAIAQNPTLIEKYGHLQVINNGYGVVFHVSDVDVLEIDGLVKNTNTLFLNETKLSLKESDIDKLSSVNNSTEVGSDDSAIDQPFAGLTSQVGKLQHILNNPSAFRSTPPEVLDELIPFANKPIVPIASGFHVPRQTLEQCRKKGVLLMSPHAQGGTYEIIFP